MKKIIKKKVIKEIIEPSFNLGDVVMFKENALLVEVGKYFVKKNKYYYKVRYSHMYHDSDYGWFDVCEDELEEKPINYESVIFEKYIEYLCKYQSLLNHLKGNYYI